MLFLFSAWRWISGAARSVGSAIANSNALKWTLIALATLAALIFGVKRAVHKARKAGERAGRETIIDKIERDTKHVLQEIQDAERGIEREIGRAPVFEDKGDGEGLTTGDLNARELERLRERAKGDSRNRGNPRSTPRPDV